MFFATASHNSLFLPVISKNHTELSNEFVSLNGEKVVLDKNITVLGFPGSNIEEVKSRGGVVIAIETKGDEEVKKMTFVDKNGHDVPILAISEMTTWKEEAIKDIGGEDAFNQEYGLRFINSSKSLLSEAIIDELLKNKKNYVHEEIPEFDKKWEWMKEDTNYKIGIFWASSSGFEQNSFRSVELKDYMSVLGNKDI